MTHQTSENKLLEIEVQDDELEAYTAFARMLAGRNQSYDHVWIMNFEDLFAEMMLEVAKGIRVYHAKPVDERTMIIKRMMVNRIKEIKHRMFVTHRNTEVGALLLDHDDADDNIPGDDLEIIYNSVERVKKTLEKLTPDARKVLEAILFGNDRLNSIMKLAAKRKTQAKYVHLKIRALYVADALLLPVSTVDSAFKEIKTVYADVCREYID